MDSFGVCNATKSSNGTISILETSDSYFLVSVGVKTDVIIYL